MGERETENITKVIFNDKLKKLYDEIHSKYPNEITNLSNIVSSKSANPFIRDVFRKNIDNIDLLSNKKLTKCDFFALITGLCVDYNELEDWEDVMYYFDDIKWVNQYENDYEENHFTECNIYERMSIINDNSGNGINSTCICGETIRNIFYLYKDGYEELVIGCICASKKIIKNNKKHPLYDKFKSEKKRMDNQKKMIIETKKEWEELVNKYRKCVDCKKYNIDISKPLWNTKCLTCYSPKKYKNGHSEKRECKTCKKYVINKDTDYDICYKCKSKEYKKCLKCGKNNVPKDKPYTNCYNCNKRI